MKDNIKHKESCNPSCVRNNPSSFLSQHIAVCRLSCIFVEITNVYRDTLLYEIMYRTVLFLLLAMNDNDKDSDWLVAT